MVCILATVKNVVNMLKLLLMFVWHAFIFFLFAEFACFFFFSFLVHVFPSICLVFFFLCFSSHQFNVHFHKDCIVYDSENKFANCNCHNFIQNWIYWFSRNILNGNNTTEQHNCYLSPKRANINMQKNKYLAVEQSK